MPNAQSVSTWSFLDTDEDVINVGAGSSDYNSICQGPDGMPWAVFTEQPEFFEGQNQRGPFVVRWDGAAYQLVTGPGSDGGIGTEQTLGALYNDVYGDAIPFVSYWPADTGTYGVARQDVSGSALAVKCYITCDEESVYANWTHGEFFSYYTIAPVPGTPYTRGHRRWWRVRMWDGASWTELGSGPNTHQPQYDQGPEPGVVPTEVGGEFGSTIHAMKAVAGDAGHPYVFYSDRTIDWADYITGTDTSETKYYVTRWSGSAWADLGGAEHPDLVTPNGEMWMELDENGNPTIIWRRTFSASPVYDEFYVSTWTGSSWVTTTVDWAALIGLPSSNYQLDTISISPIGANQIGNYRHFITATFDDGVSFGTFQGYVLEYFPATQQLRPLFNDPVVAQIDVLDTTNNSDLRALTPDPTDASVWLFGRTGTELRRIFQYDNICGLGWIKRNGPGFPTGYSYLSSRLGAYRDDTNFYSQAHFRNAGSTDFRHVMSQASIAVGSECAGAGPQLSNRVRISDPTERIPPS